MAKSLKPKNIVSGKVKQAYNRRATEQTRTVTELKKNDTSVLLAGNTRLP